MVKSKPNVFLFRTVLETEPPRKRVSVDDLMETGRKHEFSKLETPVSNIGLSDSYKLGIEAVWKHRLTEQREIRERRS